LIVDGDENTVLVPDDRYAQMNNVWFLPSTAAMIKWLKKCGFQNVRVVDEAITTTDEQRSTNWMRNESLSQYLMPGDPSRTIEGYPAPKRAVFVATRGSED
jgi:tRNA (mo5U34)-methyltransferase